MRKPLRRSGQTQFVLSPAKAGSDPLWGLDPRVSLRFTPGYYLSRLRRWLTRFANVENLRNLRANILSLVRAPFLLMTSHRVFLINLGTRSHKLLRLFFHSHSQRRLFVDFLFRRVLAHVLGDLH